MHRPRTEEELFELAAQLNGAERSRFLDRECQGDSIVRKRLEALLAAHGIDDSFMADPIEESPPVTTRYFGGYQLVEQIATGHVLWKHCCGVTS